MGAFINPQSGLTRKKNQDRMMGPDLHGIMRKDGP